MIRSFTSSEELKIRTITVSKPLNLAVHWPSKVLPVGMITDDCSTVEKNLKKLITPLDRKKYLNLVFYDNRNLKISNSKKSERYFRDKIEIFIRLFDELFVRHRYHRFPWRNLCEKSLCSSHVMSHLGEYKILSTDFQHGFRQS